MNLSSNSIIESTHIFSVIFSNDKSLDSSVLKLKFIEIDPISKHWLSISITKQSFSSS